MRNAHGIRGTSDQVADGLLRSGGWRFNPPVGWPSAPAGWRPSATWQPEASWPNPPRSWNYWLAPNGKRAAIKRPVVLRLGLFIGILAIANTAVFGATYLAVQHVQPGGYATVNKYTAAIDEALSGVRGVTFLLALVAVAVIAPRVGYRARDFLMLLIPVWNAIFICVLLWRVTNLPHVAWALRPDDRPWRPPS